jgi:hypothetical protein
MKALGNVFRFCIHSSQSITRAQGLFYWGLHPTCNSAEKPPHNTFYMRSAWERLYWSMKRQLLLAISVVGSALVGSAESLVVHEWGTFTLLQDEAGRTIGGINTDDEPVPRFCHDLDPSLVLPSDEPHILYKGVVGCHPDVTMRLETPVLYFHLPKDMAAPLTASVKVAFRGGWLTQFYPQAETSGFSRGEHLTSKTTGALAWNDLMIGGQADGPKTTDAVWTAPRAVEAAGVTATNHESERFLFYRGVAHLLAPLQVTRSADSRTLVGRAQAADAGAMCSPLSLSHLWLVSVQADGSCAFRSLPSVTAAAPAAEQQPPALFSTASEFARAEYSSANLGKLRAQMRCGLQAEGLFADEADAVLNTWEVSYFKSPGLRLFFMVPRAWTDSYLPLEVSVPCEMTRVMVGRLELVTPEQRASLRELAKAPAPKQPWAHYEVLDGRAALQGAMPPAYQSLGRFRNALLLAENHDHPSPSIEAFILLNRLQGQR